MHCTLLVRLREHRDRSDHLGSPPSATSIQGHLPGLSLQPYRQHQRRVPRVRHAGSEQAGGNRVIRRRLFNIAAAFWASVGGDYSLDVAELRTAELLTPRGRILRAYWTFSTITGRTGRHPPVARCRARSRRTRIANAAYVGRGVEDVARRRAAGLDFVVKIFVRTQLRPVNPAQIIAETVHR